MWVEVCWITPSQSALRYRLSAASAFIAHGLLFPERCPPCLTSSPLAGAYVVDTRHPPACEALAFAGLPPTRAGAPVCGSPASLPVAASGRSCGGPSGCARRRSRGDDDAAYPPRWRRPWPAGVGCCCAGPPPGRPSVRMPGNASAEPCDPAAALRAKKFPVTPQGASPKRRNNVFEHRLLQLCFCHKLFEPGVLLLELGEPLRRNASGSC